MRFTTAWQPGDCGGETDVVATLFGTDGVRGVAGVDLTAELAASLAAAAVAELAGDQARPLVAVGRDPRPSGPWLEEAVVAGLTGAGADVALLGVIPTPAVARAVADGVPGISDRPAFGIVISASHNPAPDNGIKLFGPGGEKPSDAAEADIEARLEAASAANAPVAPAKDGDAAGRVRADLAGNVEWYVEALLATMSGPLSGLRLVVDCANGAAATVAPTVYSRAGADVSLINIDLSGDHINDRCGATHLDAVRDAVVAAGADVGIAHDGDADRCLAVTAAGEVVDGDAILAILAIHANRLQRLPGAAIAATVMSNLGLARALRAEAIDVATTPVGDRSVAERMRLDGLSIGGEQSGHIVLLDHATTGDGILTALTMLEAVASSGRSLADLASVVERLPQVLINVPVADRAQALQAAAALTTEVTAELGDDGRVLVRASGTEPLVRVMVEALSEPAAREFAERIAAGLR
jgi:phosphoglucosamine mutase